MKINFSGRLYNVAAYQVEPDTHQIDMVKLREQAREVKPKVLIAGWSAYPRQQDFAEFRSIADEVGAYLWVDMAHFAGLVAAGLHPLPCRTPTSCHPRCTRHSAARAPGSSSPTTSSCTRSSTPQCSPASRAVP